LKIGFGGAPDKGKQQRTLWQIQIETVCLS